MIVCDNVEISYNDYPGDICIIVHTARCNLNCHYCFNKKPISQYRKLPFISDKNHNLYSKIIDKVTSQNLPRNLCFTGGDPIFTILSENKLEFCLSVFSWLKNEEKWNIKIDTHGLFPDEISQFYGFLDYLALDIKIPYVKKPIDLTTKYISPMMSFERYFEKLLLTIENIYKLPKEHRPKLILRTTVSKVLFESNETILEHLIAFDKLLVSTLPISTEKIQYTISPAIADLKTTNFRKKNEIFVSYLIEIPNSIRNGLTILKPSIFGEFLSN